MIENVFTSLIGCNMDLYFCGIRENTPFHEFGPSTRSHFLIQLCTCGHAVLFPESKAIPFGEGDILIHFPGETIHYKAEGDWSNKWVGLGSADLGVFLGRLDITPSSPIVHTTRAKEFEEILDKIMTVSTSPYPSETMRLKQYLYALIEIIAYEKEKQKKAPTLRSTEILRYIAAHYVEDIHVEKIAELFHLDRSYMERSFKAEMGVSIKDMIISYRLRKAQALLRESNEPIGVVAQKSGFKDRFYFSKFFRERFNMTPTEYRLISDTEEDRKQFDTVTPKET